MLITGNDHTLIQEAKAALQEKCKIKDLGEMKYFLGIETARSKEGILMNQRKFALELISELGLSGSKPVSTPMECNQKLTTVKYDKHVGDLVTDAKLDDLGPYQRLIGKLLYLTITRPDITWCTHVKSIYAEAKKISHGCSIQGDKIYEE